MQISIRNPYKFKFILGEVIKFTSKDKHKTALQSVHFYRHKPARILSWKRWTAIA